MINGRLADIYGIQTPLYVAAAAGVIALALTFFYKETAPLKLKSTREEETPTSVQV
jgi:MFS transporter, ACS family, hexuronate transporter